MRVWCEG